MRIFLVLIIIIFSGQAYSSEIILSCKMNYGISWENDETDIEFKINSETVFRTGYCEKKENLNIFKNNILFTCLFLHLMN